MKKLLKTFLLLSMAVFLVSGTTLALTTVDIPDTIYYWPEYGTAAENGTESIGNNPLIEGVKVTYDEINFKLTKLEFYGYKFEMLTDGGGHFDSLFLNTGANLDDPGWEAWDYYAKNDYSSTGGLFEYDVSGLAFPAAYDMTPASSSYRDSHPVGVSHPTVTADFLESVSLTTISSTTVYDTLEYFFSGDGLQFTALEDEYYKLTIGYAPYCANDVVLVGNVGFRTVPEPATMLLMGTGLLGLAGIGRKKFLKK